jgi:hypothetical protein
VVAALVPAGASAVGLLFGDWPAAAAAMISTHTSAQADQMVMLARAFGVGCARSSLPSRDHRGCFGPPDDGMDGLGVPTPDGGRAVTSLSPYPGAAMRRQRRGTTRGRHPSDDLEAPASSVHGFVSAVYNTPEPSASFRTRALERTVGQPAQGRLLSAWRAVMLSIYSPSTGSHDDDNSFGQ